MSDKSTPNMPGELTELTDDSQAMELQEDSVSKPGFLSELVDRLCQKLKPQQKSCRVAPAMFSKSNATSTSRKAQNKTNPPALRIADDGPDDCYVIAATAAARDADSWRLVEAMQCDLADQFELCLRRLLLRTEDKQDDDNTSTELSNRNTSELSICSIRVEYDTGSKWSTSDVDFHYVAHLCSFYAASSCFDRLLKLARSTALSQSEAATAADRIFKLQDKNNCSLLHAVCWGCYHQVKPTAAYAKFLETALKCGGAANSRATARQLDDFDFNSLELAIYLECYQLAIVFLELPGVYVQSSVHGNMITKHYLMDEYLVGSRCNRFHRAPMALLASLTTPEQISRLHESGFLQHPAMLQMGISWSVKIVLALELLPWILCLCILYIPLPMTYAFFDASDAVADPLAAIKCLKPSTHRMSVPIHAGVMLSKEDVEKRIRYALGLSNDRLATLLSEFRGNFCTNSLPNFNFHIADGHHVAQLTGIIIALVILLKAMLFPLRAIASVIVSHYKLKWRSVRYRHLYKRRTQSTDLLLLLCLFCWVAYWLLAAFFNSCFTQPCSLGLLQYAGCAIVRGVRANFTSTEANQLVMRTLLNLEVAFQAVGSFLHMCALCVNLLFLYMMESAPLFGETVMMFRQVLERFLQLSIIYIICIVIFANLFWAQTAGILHQVGAEFSEFSNMDLSSFLSEFYRVFSASLNLFDPTSRQFGNSTLSMEFKKTEIKVLHFVYILMFAILTLNFLIASLVSFIDRVARNKSTMHFLHRVYRANRVRYGLWHKFSILYRLITCNRRKRTLEVMSTVSEKNHASWVDLELQKTSEKKSEKSNRTANAVSEVGETSTTVDVSCTVVDIEEDNQDAALELIVPEEEATVSAVGRRCKTANPEHRGRLAGDFGGRKGSL